MTDTPADSDGKHPQPRDGSGQFARTLAEIERARKAAELVTRGRTYQEAADECGYSNKGDCWKAVRRLRAEAAMLDGSSEDLRQAELASLAEQRRLLWDTILNPPPAISRTGKIVTDDGTDKGHPVPDAAAVANAHAILVRVGQRIGAIRGYDAPKRSISLTGQIGPQALFEIFRDANPQDVSAAIDMFRKHVGEETARLEHTAGRAIQGHVEP